MRAKNTILITGAAGFIGSHLAERLLRLEVPTICTFFRPTIDVAEVDDRIAFSEMDVRCYRSVRDLLLERRPQTIFHLAAQSVPTISWLQPWETLHINVSGTVNLFEAIKEIRNTEGGYDPIVVVACS